MKPSSLILAVLSAFLIFPAVPAGAVDTPIDGKMEWVIGLPWGDGNIDGVGEMARFAGPLFLATDPQGGLLISDHYGATIRHADAGLRVTTLAGRSGVDAFRDGVADEAWFSWPAGLARGADGSIYVADSGNDAIRRIAPDGRVSLLAGKPGESGDTDGRGQRARFNHPESIVLDAEGRLWVAERYGRSGLRIISPNGYVRTWLPGPDDEVMTGRYGFGGIRFLALAPDGSLVMAGETAVARLKDGHLSRLLDIQTDAVPEAESQEAEAVAAAGQAAENPAALPETKLIIQEIGGMAVRADGAIFLSDKKQGLIFRLLEDGSLKIVAGRRSSERSNAADGPANVAMLEEPGSLAFDKQGRLFVANHEHSIQEILPDGSVRNVLGMARWYRKNGVDPADLPHGSLDVAIQTEKGDYFVVRRLDSEIDHYDAQGHYLHRFGKDSGSMRPSRAEAHADGEPGESRFHYPQDIVSGRDGELFVAEESGLRRIAPDGQVTSLPIRAGTSRRRDGSFEEARFFRPYRLAFDGGHSLYVLDNSPYIGRGPEGEVVRRVDLDTQQVDTVTDLGAIFEMYSRMSPEAMPQLSPKFVDIAVGPEARLYILGESGDLYTWRADEGLKKLLLANRLQQFGFTESILDAKGKKVENSLIHTRRLSGYTDHLAVDARGHAYMTDALAKVVLRRDPDGNIDIIAGMPGLAGNVAGPLPGALQNPEGLSITPGGDLLITVLYGGVIRIREPHRVRGQRVVLYDPAPASSDSVAADSTESRP